MLKVGITGHTGGIGKAIADYFTARGDQVVGFSRSNGYQLPKDWKRVVINSRDCDIFVNNARALGLNVADMSQVLIMQRLCLEWQGRDKKIINIGSISGRNPLSKHPVYTAQKAALRKMSAVYQSKQLLPRIFHLDFGKILTERTAQEPGHKMPVSDIVKVIDFYLTFPHDILDLTFRHKDALSAVA